MCPLKFILICIIGEQHGRVKCSISWLFKIVYIGLSYFYYFSGEIIATFTAYLNISNSIPCTFPKAIHYDNYMKHSNFLQAVFHNQYLYFYSFTFLSSFFWNCVLNTLKVTNNNTKPHYCENDNDLQRCERFS